MIIERIITIVIFLVVVAFVALDWLSLVFKLKGTKNTLLVLLAGFLGPFGMFYWGIGLGFASLLGMALFLIPWAYFGLPVNIWFHLLRTLVFLWFSLKINTLSDLEKKSLKTLNVASFLLFMWKLLQGFLMYGFVLYLLWKIVQ